MIEDYRAGGTLYFEAREGGQCEVNWWLDPTITKVIRFNPDNYSSTTYEREPKSPTIRSWVSPLTFETEQRLCNTWIIESKYGNYIGVDAMDLPVNDRKYTMKERIRGVA